MGKKPSLLEELIWDDIYTKWNSLPQCRIFIPGERLWGRKLPNGMVGLDNSPLDGNWRWQDIVQSENDPTIVHRRWNCRVWFKYTPAESEDKDLELRKAIFEASNKVGHCQFFSRGLGYVLLEKKEKAEEVVQVAFAALGYITEVSSEE